MFKRDGEWIFNLAYNMCKDSKEHMTISDVMDEIIDAHKKAHQWESEEKENDN